MTNAERWVFLDPKDPKEQVVVVGLDCAKRMLSLMPLDDWQTWYVKKADWANPVPIELCKELTDGVKPRRESDRLEQLGPKEHKEKHLTGMDFVSVDNLLDGEIKPEDENKAAATPPPPPLKSQRFLKAASDPLDLPPKPVIGANKPKTPPPPNLQTKSPELDSGVASLDAYRVSDEEQKDNQAFFQEDEGLIEDQENLSSGEFDQNESARNLDENYSIASTSQPCSEASTPIEEQASLENVSKFTIQPTASSDEASISMEVQDQDPQIAPSQNEEAAAPIALSTDASKKAPLSKEDEEQKWVEKRRFPRFNKSFEVAVIHGKKIFKTKSKDLSLGGIKMKKHAPVAFREGYCTVLVSRGDLKNNNIAILAKFVGEGDTANRMMFVEKSKNIEDFRQKLSDWIESASNLEKSKNKAA